MRRRLLRIGSAVSLTLCTGLIFLWVSDAWGGIHIAWYERVTAKRPDYSAFYSDHFQGTALQQLLEIARIERERTVIFTRRFACLSFRGSAVAIGFVTEEPNHGPVMSISRLYEYRRGPGGYLDPKTTKWMIQHRRRV